MLTASFRRFHRAVERWKRNAVSRCSQRRWRISHRPQQNVRMPNSVSRCHSSQTTQWSSLQIESSAHHFSIPPSWQHRRRYWARQSIKSRPCWARTCGTALAIDVPSFPSRRNQGMIPWYSLRRWYDGWWWNVDRFWKRLVSNLDHDADVVMFDNVSNQYRAHFFAERLCNFILSNVRYGCVPCRSSLIGCTVYFRQHIQGSYSARRDVK